MTIHPKEISTSRRGFLKGGVAAAASLVVGFNAKGSLAAAAGAADLNAFVKIAENGRLCVVVKHIEFGQGTTTGLATLVAEELDADWDQIDLEFAPADNERYANLLFGMQGTGGSTAIANSFLQYRQAGAAARAVLLEAAAKLWGVEPTSITIENGLLKSGDKSGHFGEFAAAAARLTPPEEPILKSAEAFKFIGNENLRRQDSSGKINGSAIFAMDVQLPGMVYAVVLHAPRFGAKLVSFDSSGAADMKGFIDAKAMPTAAGVIVYGKSTWAALQARDAITAEWDFSAAENRSSDEMVAEHLALLEEPTYQAYAGRTTDEASALVAKAETVVEADFVFPHLAHAPMETLNCVIEPTETGVRVYDGCQFPALTQPTVAAVLQLDPSRVEVQTVYAGGSFGRRANPTADYNMEAAMAFALLGGTTPVKLVWSREDDLRGGYYRPMYAHKFKIGLNGDGQIVGWDHRLSGQSIMKGTPLESFTVQEGVDTTSTEGLREPYYELPGFAIGLSDFTSPMTVLWWRAVGHTHNGVALEVALDMVAEAAGQDPLDYRLSLLPGSTKDQQRLAGVLKLAAEKAGWGTPVPDGKGRGLAVHKSFNSYVAEIVDVSVTENGAIKIDKVTCAVDCGVVVNPDIVKAQMEGGIGYGIGAAMRNTISFTDGEVDQFNFPDYEPLRITDIGAIEVHIVPSTEPPTGVGEPGLPPAIPALLNAVYSATGKRINRLPLSENGIDFA